MGLREFLIAHREQIQHACRSELGASNELQHLKQSLLSVLADGAVESEVLPLAAAARAAVERGEPLHALAQGGLVEEAHAAIRSI